MLQKNIMEDKQLNLNQPFLSVRRASPTVASGRDETKKTEYFLPTVTHPPRYKSELKSGPVRNPGVVPFRWEQSPGKPKYESKRQIRATEKPPIAPRLPPGRKLKENQDSDKSHETQNARDSTPSCMNLDEKPKEMKQDKEERESENVDEVYMDALNELTRTESFFLNCSVSGLSGLDEPEAKPSGTSLTDPQARDFMIDRFLPAAKAMASEKTLETPPHYAPKKQPAAVQEQPRQLKMVVNGDKRPQLRYGPSFALRYSQAHDNYEEEEESDDDSCYDGNLPYKVCGLLPRFCLKSSFCLMNPVPGMSVRTKVPMSPASRTRTGSSSTTSCSGSENEKYTRFQELFDYRNDASEVDLAAPLAEKTLHVDIIHKVESPIMNSCSPKAERPLNFHDKDHETLKKTTEQKPLLDSSLGYVAKPVDGRASKTNTQKEVSNGGEMMVSGQAQDGYKDAVASVKPKNDVKRSTKKQTVRKEMLENSCLMNSNLLAPPPLPKSPSDSWLCRTLPSLSTKNPSSRSYVGTGISPNNQSCKPLSNDPKWETIVKTTKGHKQHLRYTEEMMALTPIPEA
ncbi:uncharacterized protein LOC132036430 [Lycium ferocissimum]|uniref:uncharacterized protein LOC132036430 n=1 Tax=Lycium ferocissimum TaxID=112874 RepID=UPI002814A957|nr:uncharacterized protein LOC132036430 [Lycium ferocissimum]XP_059282754.1 uncharacterized protein LOC132036430 [Lycium ferocissimum]